MDILKRQIFTGIILNADVDKWQLSLPTMYM